LVEKQVGQEERRKADKWKRAGSVPAERKNVAKKRL